jgi:hypothetical protein
MAVTVENSLAPMMNAMQTEYRVWTKIATSKVIDLQETLATDSQRGACQKNPISPR